MATAAAGAQQESGGADTVRRPPNEDPNQEGESYLLTYRQVKQ